MNLQQILTRRKGKSKIRFAGYDPKKKTPSPPPVIIWIDEAAEITAEQLQALKPKKEPNGKA